MQIINFKLQENIIKEIDRSLKSFNYNNRTEFIREAIRDKIEELDTKRRLRMAEKALASAPRKVSDRQIKQARERIGKQFYKRFGLE